MDAEARAKTFRHDVLLYAGIDEFLHGTLDVIRSSLGADEHVLALFGAEKIRRLRAALGSDADRVEFRDVEVVGRNPVRMISEWHALLETRAADSRGAVGLGEPIWPARRAAELEEARRQDALVNRAFADAPGLTLLCAYDKVQLDPGLIEHARLTHPFVVESGVRRASASFAGAPSVEDALGGSLAPPAVPPATFAFDDAPLHEVRAFVAEQAARNGLHQDRVDEMVLAVDEVVSNSVRHGAANRDLLVWAEDGVVICEVRDRGRMQDPLAGVFRVPADQQGGRGLWLANQLCDLVQIRSSGVGTVVRLYVVSE
jgi:anti-sigma regulatory factor (Ser/Thr protein kinase)